MQQRAGVLADIERRHSALGDEIADWVVRARADASGLGLHVQQLETIARALDGLVAGRKQLLDELTAAADDATFAELYVDLLEDIVGAGELWRIYRTGIEQHSVSAFCAFVHEATLIASDIARAVQADARAAKVAVPEDLAPAMVFLDPALSPAAAGRFGVAADTAFVVRRYRAMQLPVPLVLVPADQATSVWSLAHLAHEVGHHLDQDLGRNEAGTRRPLTRDFQLAIAAFDANTLPSDRARRWHRWSEELLADLFGIAIGGPGYASALSRVLLPLAAAPRFATLDGDAAGPSRAPHPPPRIRVNVAMALLRLHGATRNIAMADAIATEWRDATDPAYVADFAPDLPLIADVLWKLPQEPGKAPLVRTFGAFDPSADGRFDDLVAHLANRSNKIPSAKYPDRFPRRYVPFAAELARRDTGGLDLAGIHKRAMDFAKGIPVQLQLDIKSDRVTERGAALRFGTRTIT